MSKSKWYYRLGNEDPMMGLLFTGSVNVSPCASLETAKAAIRSKHHLRRLPAQTLVINAADFEARNQWV